MSRTTRHLIALMVVTAISAPRLPAQDAMFRGGAAHTGAFAFDAVPEYGGIAWRVQTGGAVRATPTVAGGTVYAGSDDGQLYAVDANTGAVRWRAAVGSPVSSSAAVAAGMVVVHAANGSVQAFRVADGRRAWSVASGAPVPLAWGFESGLIYASSPTIANGRVFIGSLDGQVRALDLTTGKAAWTRDVGARIYSSPAVDAGAVFVGDQRGVVHALDAGNGTVRWTFRTTGASLHSEDGGFDRTTIQSSPAVSGGTVFVGARDGFLYALDAATGAERWRFDHKVSWVNASPAVAGGLVYASSSDGRFTQAVDAATGAERWRAPLNGYSWHSVSVDRALAYVNDESGTVMALDRVTGKERWRARLGVHCFSSPALGEGHVYVGNEDGAIYAFQAARGPALLRAVYWDSAAAPTHGGPLRERVRAYFASRGYAQLSDSALVRFMDARIADRAPSTIVVALEELPANVVRSATDTVLLRRSLNAGGTVVWFGAPPGIFPPDAKSLKDLDRGAPLRMLGIGFARSNFDPAGIVEVTKDGATLGLPDAWVNTNWGADPGTVTTAFAYDDTRQAAAYRKSYGGPPGTGFIRLPWGDGSRERPILLGVAQVLAELRGR